MPVARALQAYTQDKLNCAQSVLKAYEDSHGVSSERIEQARALGGGRAEGGMCGALYAALELCKSDEGKQRISSDFEQQAGALGCKEIKRGSGYPCHKCVELAADLVQKHKG